MSNKTFIAALAALALITVALVLPGRANTASAYTCTTLTSGGTYHNVTVPAGATCTLDSTRVLGNVTVQAGATLLASTSAGDTTVAGNISGKDCNEIDLESTGLSGRIVVGGNLTITNCTSISFQGGRGSSSSPPVPPPTLLIGGNVKCDNNPGGCVFDYAILSRNFECVGNFDCELQSDAVGGKALLGSNTSEISVENSIVGGNLSCTGNGSASGLGNTVAGKESGQCVGF